MSTKLGTVLADFTTNLATAIVVGGTSATLQSATDDDGVALPAGRYFFTLDGSNSNKEHMSCDLSGTSLTNIKSVSRQGVETTGLARAHRIGCTVTLTDFAHLLYINNLVAGTTLFNSLVKLGYDGDPGVTSSDLNYFATVKFVNSVAIAGASNASTTVKGIVQEATLAQILGRTAAGSTGAQLYINPVSLPSTLFSDYKIDTGTANAYAVAPSPAITAYVDGQVFSFKAIHANTGASTLAVSGLTAITIKNSKAADLVANDILLNQVIVVEYIGGIFQMLNPTGNLQAQGLQSATTVVSVSAATAPSNTQVLTATSSTNATWQTPAVPLYASGTTTKNAADASTTQNIAHGLGKIPKYIRITAIINTTATLMAQTTYNGTTQSSISTYTISNTGTVGLVTTFSLSSSGASGSDVTSGVTTFDGTNIIITWTRSGSPTGTYNLLWEAFA